MQRHDVVAADQQMELLGNRFAVRAVCLSADSVEHQQHVAPVGLALRVVLCAAERLCVPQGKGVEAEQFGELLEVFLTRVGEIEPEELVAVQEPLDLVRIDPSKAEIF